MYSANISLIDVIEEGNNKAFVQYIIKGVHYEESVGKNTSTDGKNNNKVINVIIPANYYCSESYLSPKQWLKLSNLAKMQYFTLREGQYLVNTDEVLSFNSLDELYAKYDGVSKISEVAEYFSVIKHFEIKAR